MTPSLHRFTWRRTAAAGAVAAMVLPLTIALPGTAAATDAASCVANGPTYAVDNAGALKQYKLKSPINGADGYVAPTSIGTGWNVFGRVLAGPDGTFYGVKSDGLYYGHRTSAGTWDVSPKRVSKSFGWLIGAEYHNNATVDRAGRLWVVDKEGVLRMYKYFAATDTWDPSVSRAHDDGWNRYNLITAGDAGVLYGRDTTDGKLYRSRYDVTSQRWIERHVLVSPSNWNQFKSISSNGGDTILATKASNGSAYYYRFDENTRTFPVNQVQVGTADWQNFRDVSAAPDNCQILGDHTPATPSVPLESYSRTAVFNSARNSLEFAYSDNIGRLMHGRMADPDNTNSVQWTPVGGSEAFSGEPSLAGQSDGRVVVTGHTTAGQVLQLNQKTEGSSDWDPWIDLAGSMSRHVITAKTPGGLLVQFSADAAGTPWYRIQTAANGDFKGWMPLPGTGFTGAFTAVTVRNGIQLFGKDSAGILSTALFSDTGALTSWTALGTQAVTGTPSVVVYPGYLMRVFATDTNGTVVTATQSAEGGAFGAWSPISGLTVSGSPAAIISPTNGLTEIIVRGADGYIHNTGETVQGSGTWRPWGQQTYDAAATEPTVVSYTTANGPSWGYVYRTSSNQTMFYHLSTAFAGLRSGSAAPSFTGAALPAPR